MSVKQDFLVVSSKIVEDKRASLIVGRPDTTTRKTLVINTFSGNEALRLYDKLALPNVDVISHKIAVDQELQLLMKRYGKEAVIKAFENVSKKED